MNPPKTKELKLSKLRILLLTFSPSVIVFFILLGLSSSDQQSDQNTWISYFLIGGLALWIIGYWYHAFIYKIILDKHTIKEKSIFGTKQITIEEIGTYKVNELGFHIFLKHATNSPKLLITTSLDHPQVLLSWLHQYSRNPELEAAAKEYEEEVEEILEKDSFGKNKIEKEENLATTRKIAQWLHWITLVNVFWSMLGTFGILPFVEISYCIALLSPILLIYFSVKYKGFFDLDMEVQQASNFPRVGAILTMPSLSLGSFWIFTGLHQVDTYQIWPYAFLIALLIAIPMFLTVRAMDFKKISTYINTTAVVLVLLGYGYGAIAVINLYFDTSEATTFSVQVLNKEAGKDPSSTHYITLAPWHSYQEATTVEVYYSLLEQVEVGEEVTVYLKEGFLGVSYYGVQAK